MSNQNERANMSTIKTDEFIRGIAAALDCDAIEAEAQWAGYSRQLDDGAIREIESEGYFKGVQIGREIASL